MTTEHTFQGKWITSARFAALEPRNVFHRQLAPAVPPESPELQNRHVLFRRKFTLTAEQAKSVKIYISADDYYKLYVNGKEYTEGTASEGEAIVFKAEASSSSSQPGGNGAPDGQGQPPELPNGEKPSGNGGPGGDGSAPPAKPGENSN